MHYKMESTFNLDLHEKSSSSIWVFGYGSLVWRPGFEFHSKRIGFIQGFARRFWQGNATHRGTPTSPGRVATLVQQENVSCFSSLFAMNVGRGFNVACRYVRNGNSVTVSIEGVECNISDKPIKVNEHQALLEFNPTLVKRDIKFRKSVVWGVAFELKGEQQIRAAFEHLGVRECELGGYATKVEPFVSRDEDSSGARLTLPALVFMAVPDNLQYLGEASIPELRDQIIRSQGACGHNVEYVVRLADFIRTHIPEEDDPHLFELDSAIRAKLVIMNVALHTLIGSDGNFSESARNDNDVTSATEDVNQNVVNKDGSHTKNNGSGKNSDSWESQEVPKDCPKEMTQMDAMKVQS